MPRYDTYCKIWVKVKRKHGKIEGMNRKIAFLIFFILPLLAACNFSEDLNTAWEFKTGYLIRATPVVSGHNVYVGSDRFYCLNAETGKPVWEFKTFGIVSSSALIEDGYVYFQCGGLYCLDAATGDLVWEFWTGEWGDGEPAIADGYVYSTVKKNVYCIDAKNGKKIWAAKVRSDRAPPSVSDGHVYIESIGKIYCLDAKSGRVLWDFNISKKELFHTVSDGRVYVGSLDKKFYCIDGSTGSIIWSYDIGFCMAKPVVSGDYVYISARKVYCFNAVSGSLVWESGVGAAGRRLLSVSEGNLYVNIPSRIICIDVKTGKKLWDYKVPRGKFVIADKRIYLGSYDYKVYCLKFPEGQDEPQVRP